MRTTRFALALSTLLTSAAFADESPDNMIAHGHFARGAEAYDKGHYEDALREFEAAHAAEALPAFDYNIARCFDHLGRRAEALGAYERYLIVAPAADNVIEVRTRVERLRHELAEVVPAAAAVTTQEPSRADRHSWAAPGAVGGGALVFAAIGAGLLGSAASSYHGLSSSCSPGCSPGSWSALPAREHAGEALLGVAAVAAVVDVALIIRAARRK